MFKEPKLPVDLNEGYPESYMKDPEGGEATPVETIVRAALQAKVDMSKIQICTFRRGDICCASQSSDNFYTGIT